MNADNLYHREFRPLLKKARLSGFTFHSLRHTCATLLCFKNVNSKLVQEIMGQANISQAMGTYFHLMLGMGEAATMALEEALSKNLLLPYCCQKPPTTPPVAFVLPANRTLFGARSAGLEPATF